MNPWLRYLVPAGGALVIAIGAASSSRASATSREVVLTEEGELDGCRTVIGASGADRLCASSTAGSTVVAFRAQPAGLACPAGGRAVSWGADANGNRALDPSELEGSTYVCQHARARSDANRALVATKPLALRDGNCPAGGALVQTGIDRDGDGVLAANEIDRATFACNRFGGPALVATVDVTDEPPGRACAHGGKRIALGHDGETPRISYACNAR